MKEALLIVGVTLILTMVMWQIGLRYRQKQVLANIETQDPDGIYLFTTPTCAVCREMKRVYAGSIHDETIRTIDVVAHSDFAKRYGILGVPAIVVLRQGRVAETFLGFVKPAELMAWFPRDKGGKS